MSTVNTRVSAYLGKMAGGSTAVGGASVREAWISGLGGLVGIGTVSYLSYASGFPWLTAPFGATSVLIFAVHRSPLAQPRNVVGGYLVSALSGLVMLAAFGNTWWSVALGVGLAILTMGVTRTTHPPAGGVPIVMITGHATAVFVARPVLLGAVTLVIVAALYNNLFRERRYPEYWW